LAVSADSAREAFESGFAIVLERGHDTAQVRAEVTHEIVCKDLAVRERALKDHIHGADPPRGSAGWTIAWARTATWQRTLLAAARHCRDSHDEDGTSKPALRAALSEM